MSKRRDPNPTFDLFIPLMNDLPLKDQREVMERPFFSLQKRKRLKRVVDARKRNNESKNYADEFDDFFDV